MEPLGIDERREVWGHVGSRENSRRVTGFPGRAERRGVWGARRIRGASRVSRDAPSVGGVGGAGGWGAGPGVSGERGEGGGGGGRCGGGVGCAGVHVGWKAVWIGAGGSGSGCDG